MPGLRHDGPTDLRHLSVIIVMLLALTRLVASSSALADEVTASVGSLRTAWDPAAASLAPAAVGSSDLVRLTGTGRSAPAAYR